jgi:hypothetical protein
VLEHKYLKDWIREQEEQEAKKIEAKIEATVCQTIIYL